MICVSNLRQFNNKLYQSACKKTLFTVIIIIATSAISLAQTGWTICNSPELQGRVDDIFMCNPQTGYAVCGDGKIIKTMNGGNDWSLLFKDTSNYYRSVEFIDTQKGFVGGFNSKSCNNNIFLMTSDGGHTWTDLTSLINYKAQKGICGLAVADTNTIYGCGNWFQDSAYIIKSADKGNSWNYIDMSSYASSLIDMHFITKDTGFATGRGLAPLKTAIILYTTNGGQTWTYKFKNTIANEYCWKIQQLTNKIYFASIEDFTLIPPTILKSTDGGMNWIIHKVSTDNYNVEGIGFIDTLKGWTGGGMNNSFESNDGGISWEKTTICPGMNRVFKVNDSLLFASGNHHIWKYKSNKIESTQYNSINCHPNPVSQNLIIDVTITKSTHALIVLFDELGREIKIIDNSDKPKGSFQYNLSMNNFQQGTYYIVLKTHEGKQTKKIIVNH